MVLTNNPKAYTTHEDDTEHIAKNKMEIFEKSWDERMKLMREIFNQFEESSVFEVVEADKTKGGEGTDVVLRNERGRGIARFWDGDTMTLESNDAYKSEENKNGFTYKVMKNKSGQDRIYVKVAVAGDEGDTKSGYIALEHIRKQKWSGTPAPKPDAQKPAPEDKPKEVKPQPKGTQPAAKPEAPAAPKPKPEESKPAPEKNETPEKLKELFKKLGLSFEQGLEVSPVTRSPDGKSWTLDIKDSQYTENTKVDLIVSGDASKPTFEIKQPGDKLLYKMMDKKVSRRSGKELFESDWRSLTFDPSEMENIRAAEMIMFNNKEYGVVIKSWQESWNIPLPSPSGAKDFKFPDSWPLKIETEKDGLKIRLSKSKWWEVQKHPNYREIFSALGLTDSKKDDHIFLNAGWKQSTGNLTDLADLTAQVGKAKDAIRKSITDKLTDKSPENFQIALDIVAGSLEVTTDDSISAEFLGALAQKRQNKANPSYDIAALTKLDDSNLANLQSSVDSAKAAKQKNQEAFAREIAAIQEADKAAGKTEAVVGAGTDVATYLKNGAPVTNTRLRDNAFVKKALDEAQKQDGFQRVMYIKKQISDYSYKGNLVKVWEIETTAFKAKIESGTTEQLRDIAMRAPFNKFPNTYKNTLNAILAAGDTAVNIKEILRNPQALPAAKSGFTPHADLTKYIEQITNDRNTAPLSLQQIVDKLEEVSKKPEMDAASKKAAIHLAKFAEGILD